MSAHVIFGTGPVGRATATALLDMGAHVTIASRSASMALPPSGAKLVALDLGDMAAATRACTGASAIYFCAAPAYHKWVREFPPMLDAVIGIAERSGARLVIADNLYAYGPVDAPMVETLPLRPNTRKGRVRAAMHERVLAAQRTGRIEFASGRASDFFGPWVDGSAVGSRLFHVVAKGGTATLMGDPDQPHSYTYINDFGRALAILGTDARGVNQVWHVPNAPTVSSRRFAEIAFRMAGREPRIRAGSRAELALIGLIIPAVRESIEMLYEFKKPFVVDHSKFAGVFGDTSTPLERSLADTLDWVRTRGTQ